MKVRKILDDFLFEIDNFLSSEQCSSFIEKAELLGFEEALITTRKGALRAEDIRNNDRVIHDNTEIAEELWQALKPAMPPRFRNRNVVGLNERMRIYRYGPGQLFDWHHDGYFERENGERSLFTFLIYLNDDFEGGCTTFSDFQTGRTFDDITVVPKQGRALVFFHPFMHRGDEVLSGKKYVARSDVMYSLPTEH